MAYEGLNDLDKSLVNDMIIESLKDPEVRQEYIDALKANKPEAGVSANITENQQDAFQEILDRQRDEWSERMNEIPLGLRRAYDNNRRDEINDLGAQSQLIRTFRDHLGYQINSTGYYYNDDDMLKWIDNLKEDHRLPLRWPKEGNLGVDAEKVAEAVAGIDVELQEADQIAAALPGEASDLPKGRQIT